VETDVRFRECGKILIRFHKKLSQNFFQQWTLENQAINDTAENL
jgi:hypothetical protein